MHEKPGVHAAIAKNIWNRDDKAWTGKRLPGDPCARESSVEELTLRWHGQGLSDNTDEKDESPWCKSGCGGFHCVVFKLFFCENVGLVPANSQWEFSLSAFSFLWLKIVLKNYYQIIKLPSIEVCINYTISMNFQHQKYCFAHFIFFALFWCYLCSDFICTCLTGLSKSFCF